MSDEPKIVTYTMSEIMAMREDGEDKTDPNTPEAESLGAEFWKNARIVLSYGQTKNPKICTLMW
jgi:hypothetical protein